MGLIIEVATDNENRTAADLRLILSKHHGHFVSSGSVSYMFRRKGQITVSKQAATDDTTLELAPHPGAEDVNSDEERHVILTAHDQLYVLGETLRGDGLAPDSQRFTFIPDSLVHVADDDIALQVIQLCEALEDNEDVQHVYANFEPSEAVLAKISG